MKIYFIRHGETTGDVEGRFGGDYDDNLSETGLKQVEQLAKDLASVKLAKIYTSPLIRTKETAEYLENATGVEVVVVPNLRERNSYGVITGLTKAEADSQYPGLSEQVKDRLNTITGAETYEAFSKRISGAWTEIVSNQTESTIAIVSHGGPMRVLCRDILSLGELTKIGDCSFIELEINDGKVCVINMNGVEAAFNY
jgi:broad specificity phosphatase PhoE